MRSDALRQLPWIWMASLVALGTPAVARAAPPNEVGTWVKKQPAHAPSARANAGMTYDEARQRVVLFGGGSTAQTWEWDGTDWADKTPPAPAKSPAARIDPALAYDPIRRRVVLFGGGVGAASANDTWEWDGTSWVERTPANKPSAREAASMVFDEERAVMVLFGGLRYAIGNVNETWTWNGTNWTQRTVSGNKPEARQQHRIAYDAKRKRVVLYGGRTWENAVLSDTWEWTGAAWQNRSPSTKPGPRASFGIASSGGRGKVVLFGGRTSTSGDSSAETWEWNGTTWAKPTLVGAGPSSRRGTALVYDEARHETIAFGGFLDGQGYLAETWVYRSRGGACSDVGACDAAACEDGVCCDRACDGSCEACNLAGSVGTCSFVTGAPTTGHPACNGAGACSGKCSGSAAACTYPAGTTSCGASTCVDGVGTSYACDGAGMCKTKGQSCADAGGVDAGEVDAGGGDAEGEEGDAGDAGHGDASGAEAGTVPGRDGGISFDGPDASSGAGTADIDDEGGADSEGGCGCRSTHASSGEFAGALGLALGFVALRRRRR